MSMVSILMMSAKLATPNLIKIKIFRNKGYDIIILNYDVTNKILSRDSNHIIDVVMWTKFLWEKLAQRPFDKDLIKKNTFFEGWSWFNFNNLGLALVMILKLYTSVAKGLKIKVRKLWGLSHTFAEVTREKTGRGPGSPSPNPE